MVFGMLVVVLVLFLITEGGHFFNRNRLEQARRAQCMHQLQEIGKVISDRGLRLDVTNRADVGLVLDQLGLRCPSGLRVQPSQEGASYFVATNAQGTLVVIESNENHNPARMRFTKLAPVTYCLGTDGVVGKISAGGLREK